MDLTQQLLRQILLVVLNIRYLVVSVDLFLSESLSVVDGVVGSDVIFCFVGDSGCCLR